MSDPLDLPLESLITSRRTRRTGRAGGAPRRIAQPVAYAAQQFPSGALPAGAQIVYIPMPVQSAPVRSGGPLRQQPRVRRVAPYVVEERGRWQHDLSEADEISQRGSSMRVTIGSKVEVSNLHHTVNETVLKDVFKAIGDVKSVEIEYDRTDRSTGRGYVIFEREEDARRAVSEYQGLKMADQPVTLRFLGSNLVERERKAPQGGMRRAPAFRGGRGGRGRGRGGRRDRQPLTKEQLDAQLVEMTKGDA